MMLRRSISDLNWSDMREAYINYLDRFRCIADRCPDTCCSGWAIEIDNKSIEKYRTAGGEYRKVLDARIDKEERVFMQKDNGDCCFLCENKLCEMYIILGEAALCNTCKLYPRHIEIFENTREITLSVSCPEAARLLLVQTEPLSIVTNTETEYDEYCSEECFDDFNSELYECLLQERESLLGIMQNRNMSYYERAAQIVSKASDLQDELDGFALYEEEGLENAEFQISTESKDITAESTNSVISLSSYEMACSLFSCLNELEHLKDDREEMLHKANQILYSGGAECWSENKRKFEVYCKDSGLNLEIICEQLTVYYLYSYFCGAVYDDYVFSKVMGAVAHTILIKELWMADWLANSCNIDFDRMVCILYEYARELENSNQNLIKMDEMMDEIGF